MAKSSDLTISGSGMKRFNSIHRGTNIAYSFLFILLALLCVIPVIFVVIISFSSEASHPSVSTTWSRQR